MEKTRSNIQCFAFSYMGKMSKKATLGFVFKKTAEHNEIALEFRFLGVEGNTSLDSLSHYLFRMELLMPTGWFSKHRLGVGGSVSSREERQILGLVQISHFGHGIFFFTDPE